MPNAETAIKIAEAIWLPIFGDAIYDSKPFVAELINNNEWKVRGSSKAGEKIGGPNIIIDRHDCRIKGIYFSK